MCGIVGYLRTSTKWQLPPDFLERACVTMAHRGPDDQGVIQINNGQVGLGMRRLSIIDLSTGNQPMISDDRQVVIVFNGEIYNYLEIRRQLESHGCCFHTTSDTEVLLQAYQVYGVDCLQHLNGMYAFAIWDNRARHLFIARDRFGEKPLYFYYDQGGFVFASEIKSLLEAPFVPRKLNHRAFDHFLTWLAVPHPDTMFEAIHKLAPAHYVLVKEDGSREFVRYWQLAYPEHPQRLSPVDAAERLLDRMQESVRLRLRADVPLGILLSGGVDSSALVALVSREKKHSLRTFSVGFDIPGFDEFQYSRVVAQRYKTDHSEVCMPAEQYWQMTQEAVWHLDEPMADTASVALMYICKVAQRSCKVLLSGEGSDEILAGYLGRYVNGIRTLGGLSALGQNLPHRVRHWLRQRLGQGRLWPDSRQAIWKLSQPLEYQFLKASVYGFYEGLREPLYYGGPLQGYQPDEADMLHTLHNNGHTLLQRMTYTDSVINLPNYLLQKADKMSMAASIELRAPFLDHQLAEFCATLPDEYKLDRQCEQGKAILKQALRGLLPEDLLFRPKMGFPVPIDDWLRDRLHGCVKDLVLDPRARINQFLNLEHIRNMWKAHQDGRQVFGLQLWQLALVELWMNRFNISL